MYYELSFEQFGVGFVTTAAGIRAPQFARWSPLGTLAQANSANSINQYISINRPAAAVASCCARTSDLTGLGS
jgi:hypothetical protein